MIAAGRVLTGAMPRDINQLDFRAFTCRLSKFVRRSKKEGGGEDESALKSVGSTGEGMLSNAARMNGKGVAGGWDCLLDSDCTHLLGGEERGWYVLFDFLSPFTPFPIVFFDSRTRDLNIHVLLGQNFSFLIYRFTLEILETQEPNTLNTISTFAGCILLYRHFSGDEAIGDVGQDCVKSKKDDNLIREKARGKDNSVKL